MFDTVRERGVSIGVDENGDHQKALESTRWRGRSIGVGLASEEDATTTLSLRVTASEADLVGMGLSWIPTSPKRGSRHATNDANSPNKEIHRVFKISVGRMSLLRKRSGGRTATFFAVLLWLIGSASVAALAAILVPRFMQHSQTALAGAEPRAAVKSRAAVWGEPGALRRHAEGGCAGGGCSIATLFDPQALQGCVDAASEAWDALRSQLDPLSQQQTGCVRSSVPGMPIAAAGLASAVASVLTTTPAELESEESVVSGARSDASDDHLHLDVPRALLLARLCGASYFSCDADTDGWEARERLEEELEATGLSLTREIHGAKDEYVYVARDDSRVVVVFRGSCTLNNVLTDIDMVRGGADSAAQLLAEATGLPTSGMILHRGFVEAYLNVREELLDTLGELSLAGPRDAALELHVTGHSMGGAMATLAALEIAHRQRMQQQHRGVVARAGLAAFARPETYTFAAPRVGDAFFADFFTRTFPAPHEYWALQAPSDAVPHLPFSAWGFRHPTGVAKLGVEPSDRNHCTAAPIRRSADEGDSVELLRPKDGDVKNWAFCHDLAEYVHHLQQLAGGAPAQVASPLAAA